MLIFRALLDALPLDAAAKQEIAEAMQEPHRAYHATGHLAYLWRRHMQYAGQAGVTGKDAHQRVALSIAFHDLVYDPRRSDNEARSADRWDVVARRNGVPPDTAGWVGETIRATSDHLSYQARGDEFDLTLWFLDLDLLPLSEPTSGYLRNERLLRREFIHLSDEEWRVRNLSFLTRVQSSERIYRSCNVFMARERRARRNMAQTLGAG